MTLIRIIEEIDCKKDMDVREGNQQWHLLHLKQQKDLGRTK
jgi:hypothetical protein